MESEKKGVKLLAVELEEELRIDQAAWR